MTDNVRVLPNGAIYSMDTHKIIANPGGGNKGITHENASALASKRWEIHRDAATEGIVQAIVESGLLPDKDRYSHKAWQAIINRMTVLLLSSTDQAKAARLLLALSKLAGLDNPARVNNEANSNGSWGEFLQQSNVSITIEHKADEPTVIIDGDSEDISE